jgi:hypothetical protein
MQDGAFVSFALVLFPDSDHHERGVQSRKSCCVHGLWTCLAKGTEDLPDSNRSAVTVAVVLKTSDSLSEPFSEIDLSA